MEKGILFCQIYQRQTQMKDDTNNLFEKTNPNPNQNQHFEVQLTFIHGSLYYKWFIKQCL